MLGDRRDHFESLKDLWDIFNVVVEERKKREIDPTLTILRQCEVEAEQDEETPDEIKQRIKAMTEFLETLSGWYEQMSTIPRSTIMKLMKLGSRITRLLNKA